MTPKELRVFSANLRRMSAFEVREETLSSVQPDAVKRAMAVTELERRRQARAPATLARPARFPILSLVLFIAGGAVACWAIFLTLSIPANLVAPSG